MQRTFKKNQIDIETIKKIIEYKEKKKE